MGRLAVVGGNSILGTGYPPGAELREMELAGGTVALADVGSHVVLQRHGLGRYTLPHAIDHAANLHALRKLGCDRALAIGSVGGLRTELGVGTFLCPDDFIALHLAELGAGRIAGPQDAVATDDRESPHRRILCPGRPMSFRSLLGPMA